MQLQLALWTLLLAGGVVGQDEKPKPNLGKVLPLSTKPARMIPEVGSKPLTSISEYYVEELKTRQRVFRYNWKGDYDSFVQMLRRKYVGKKGWRLAEIKGDGSWEFSRDHKTGPVLMESYLIQSRRIIKDPKAPSGWVGRYTPPGKDGWIWVSYNERYAK